MNYEKIKYEPKIEKKKEELRVVDLAYRPDYLPVEMLKW